MLSLLSSATRAYGLICKKFVFFSLLFVIPGIVRPPKNALNSTINIIKNYNSIRYSSTTIYSFLLTGTLGLIGCMVRFDGGPKYSLGCSACFSDNIRSSGTLLLNFFALSSLRYSSVIFCFCFMFCFVFCVLNN